VTSGPDADVIVVNWNDAQSTARTIQAIRSDPSAVTRRMIVVDNGSREPIGGLGDDVEIVSLPTNLGFGGGVNAALAVSSAPVVVLVNNDARPRAGFLDALVSALINASPDVAAIAGRILLSGKYRSASTPSPDDLVSASGERWARADDDPGAVELINSTGTLVSRSGNGQDRDWLLPSTFTRAADEVFGFSGGAVALRRAALDAVGPFDPDLFMYFEDTELVWRLRRAGWSIRHEPTAVVDHDHARSSGVASPFFVENNVRNRLVVATIHGGPGLVVSAWARALAHAVSESLRGRSEVARANRRGVASAIRALPSAARRRRRVDRTASVSRRELAHWLVD
jgi:GT2 family glycosyltransferase